MISTTDEEYKVAKQVKNGTLRLNEKIPSFYNLDI